MKIQISKGKKKRAVRTVLYGVAGVGKSTFCSQIENAVFIDTESGTDEMDVARLPQPNSWADIVEEIEWAKDNIQGQTLVIDTIDRAEMLLIEDTLEKDGKTSIEDYGYGKGYVLIQERWQKEFLFRLDTLIAAGINVVLVGHSIVKKMETPTETAYDHWELNLGRKTAPITRDWADMLLFCNFESTIVDTGNGMVEKRKAVGKLKRKIYCNQQPQFDAKNRYGLADSYNMSYEPFRDIFDGNVVRTEERTVLDLNTENKGIVDDSNPLEVSYSEKLVTELQKHSITVEEFNTWCESTGRPTLENQSDLSLENMTNNIDMLVKAIKGGKQ